MIPAIRFALLLSAALLSAVAAQGQLPDGYIGVWEGIPTTSPLGPFDETFTFTIHPIPGGWLMYDIINNDFGPKGFQTFEVLPGNLTYRGFLIRYFDHPAPIVTKFHEMTSSSSQMRWCVDPKSQRICWTLFLNGDTLTSSFQLGSPAQHFFAQYTRTSPSTPDLNALPPAVRQAIVHSLEGDDPVGPSDEADLSCPFIGLQHSARELQPTPLKKDYEYCYILNPKLNAVVAWNYNEDSETIDVAVAMDKFLQNQWVGLGLNPDFPGMIGADIALGYTTSAGGCVRSMYAKHYVGLPVDQTEQVLTNTSVEDDGDTVTMRFTRGFFSGHQNTTFWSHYHVMYASGIAPSHCEGSPTYHSNNRGVAIMDWANPENVFPKSMVCP